MKKDQTVTGITGKPVPKPKTPKQQYELEKKRRMKKHLGQNVGGVSYSSDVSPYYNPRQRTFEEFMLIAEGKKKEKKKEKDNTPVNAVPGTYREHPDGSKSYILKPYEPRKSSKPMSKKKIFKELERQGGIGAKSIRKGQEKNK